MNFGDLEVPVSGVVRLAQMDGDDEEDRRLLRLMAEGARNYIEGFPWCRRTREAFYGDGYGGVVAVFLFLIEPARADIDEWLWVVFGDVPPAYLVLDHCKSPSEALAEYVEEVRKWVRLAKDGRQSSDVIPVNVSATTENAMAVGNRLTVLSEIVIPAFREKERQMGNPPVH